MSKHSLHAPRSAFEAHAEGVVRRLCDAVAEVIAAVPGFTYRRPNDLAGELGLPPKLAWNLGRCIEGPDPFASAQFLPGPSGMRAFLRAARRRSTPPELVGSAEQAFELFCQLVREHAGTRKHFNMLAAGLASTDRARADVEHRRRTFEGNTYIWGVHARTVFRANIVHPSADPDMWDLASIRGFVDFQCVRPNVAWRIGSSFSVDTDHHIHHEVRSIALDARVTDGQVPLLADFCTQPIARFRRVVGPRGEPEYEFVQSSVGNTARFTCVTGELLRRAEPCFRSERYDEFCVAFSPRTPAEALVFDVLIHRTLFEGSGSLTAELYSDLFGGGPEVRYEPNDRLPMHESVVYLGRSLDAARTADIPRYRKLLRFALDQAGWDEADFDVYRLRVQYPPIPTTMMLRKRLPARATYGAPARAAPPGPE
jgi:hypothetical protein